MDSAEVEAALLALLQATSKASRRLHSISVAYTAETLCRRFGLDPVVGRIGGLGHDIVKDRPIGEQWDLAGRVGLHPATSPLTDLVHSLRGTEFADKVIHGPAAAVFLRESALAESGDILRAVAYHSTARMGMGPLEKLLFAADKLEPGRKGIGAEDARALLELGIEDLFHYALGRSIAWLGLKGGSIAQSTVDLYNSLGSAGRGT